MIFDTLSAPSDCEASPEVKLGFAIIARAVTDLFIGASNEPSQKDAIRHEALRFLTDASGPWAESRRDFCLICNFDPDQVRERMIDILEGLADMHFGHDGRQQLLSRLDDTRALWARHKEGHVVRAGAQKLRDKNRHRIAAKREQLDRLMTFLELPRRFGEIKKELSKTQGSTRLLLDDLIEQRKVIRTEEGGYVLAPQLSVEAA